jgi:serine protease Do
MKAKAILWALAALGIAAGRAGSAEPTLAEEAAFRGAVDRVAAAVVRIEPLALSTAADSAEAAAGRGPSTGLIVSPGHVLATAFAVPDDVDSAVVVLPAGGRRAARVRARDASRGLVLLAVENLPAAAPLEPAPRAGLRPGQWAIAVGRGWDAATASPAVGIVSAVNRAWGKGVQTDAAVSPMNYGGPLVDIAGRVIGVLAALPAEAAGMTKGTELYDAGIGFAVPLEDVLAVLPRLERGESLAPGILGIGYRSRDAINGEPVLASVRQGSPAAQAGLRPGDRIVRIDGAEVTRIADARHAIAPRYAGDTIAITVERAGGDAPPRSHETTATLVAELPPWRRSLIGVVAAPPAADAETAAGLDVAWVLPGGPADEAGLRPGDRIDALAVGEASPPTSVDSPEAAAGGLAAAAPGDEVAVSFTREGVQATVTMAVIPVPADVPATGPIPAPAGGDLLARPEDAVDVVPLEGADVAEPALAVIPRGTIPLGVLVWCGPPRGKPTAAEANAWKAAAARHGVAVILPGSAADNAWSRDDIPAVTRALAALATRRPIDPARIGIAGDGAGAAFAWLVAERLGAVVGGVALVDAGLPRRAVVEPAQPGRSWWVLLGPGDDDELRRQVAADRARLERAGHAVAILPGDPTAAAGEEADEAAAAAAAPGGGQRVTPAELLCRWVSLLGLL